jgi:hypothetical protein
MTFRFSSGAVRRDRMTIRAAWEEWRADWSPSRVARRARAAEFPVRRPRAGRDRRLLQGPADQDLGRLQRRRQRPLGAAVFHNKRTPMYWTVSVVRTNEKPDWLFYVSIRIRPPGRIPPRRVFHARQMMQSSQPLDLLGRADVTRLEHIKRVAPSEFALWLGDQKKARRIPHRLEARGYVPVRNPDVKDGLWKIDGTRRPVYARHELSRRDRLTAASRLVR